MTVKPLDDTTKDEEQRIAKNRPMFSGCEISDHMECSYAVGLRRRRRQVLTCECEKFASEFFLRALQSCATLHTFCSKLVKPAPAA